MSSGQEKYSDEVERVRAQKVSTILIQLCETDLPTNLILQAIKRILETNFVVADAIQHKNFHLVDGETVVTHFASK